MERFVKESDKKMCLSETVGLPICISFIIGVMKKKLLVILALSLIVWGETVLKF